MMRSMGSSDRVIPPWLFQDKLDTNLRASAEYTVSPQTPRDIAPDTELASAESHEQLGLQPATAQFCQFRVLRGVRGIWAHHVMSRAGGW
jgi:hypothetical protein